MKVTTDYSPDVTKDEFYFELDDLKKAYLIVTIVLTGDLNAQDGSLVAIGGLLISGQITVISSCSCALA